MTEGTTKEKCFVIMPISDAEGYEEGHFAKIYEQLFKPAIEAAGYESHRVDEDKSVGMIHAKILTALVEAPMVLCDLSTRNPNVLFELGLRQAFDKPAILVQEVGTARIFDIAGIDAIDYRKNRLYDEIIEDQRKITTALTETRKDGKFNSLIKLLKIQKADFSSDMLSKEDTTEMMLRGIINEISSLNNRLTLSTSNDKISNAVFNTKHVKKIDMDNEYYNRFSNYEIYTKAKYLRDCLCNADLDMKNREMIQTEVALLLHWFRNKRDTKLTPMDHSDSELADIISDLDLIFKMNSDSTNMIKD